MRRILAAAAVAAAALSSASAAPRPWTLVQAQNVTVVGQQPARTLRGIAAAIEQFRAAVGSLFAGADQPLPMPTIVYAFDDRAALEPYLPLYDGKPAALAGYCHCGSTMSPNVIAVSLASFADSSAIIFHEYTHVLVRNAAASVPLWLSEGLAEFYSSFALSDSGQSMHVGRPLDHHVQLLRRQRLIAVADLLRVDPSSPLYNEANRRSTFYAEAWALTHYLLVERADGAAAINRYIAALAGGAPAEEAFRTAFDISPAQMDRVLSQYIHRPVFRSSILPLAVPVDVDAPDAVRALPAAEAEARLGAIQLGVQRAAEAAPRIEAAAAAAPDIADAQLTLGLLRMHQNRLDDASRPLARAAELAPGDFLTQFTYGLTLLRQAIGNGEAARAGIERARTALSRALGANPQSAEALAWQAFADLVVNDHLDEAHAAIARAVELAPGRMDLRVRQAEVLLREERVEDATAILRVVARSTTDPESARQAKSLLASLHESSGPGGSDFR